MNKIVVELLFCFCFQLADSSPTNSWREWVGKWDGRLESCSGNITMESFINFWGALVWNWKMKYFRTNFQTDVYLIFNTLFSLCYRVVGAQPACFIWINWRTMDAFELISNLFLTFLYFCDFSFSISEPKMYTLEVLYSIKTFKLLITDEFFDFVCRASIFIRQLWLIWAKRYTWNFLELDD